MKFENEFRSICEWIRSGNDREARAAARVLVAESAALTGEVLLELATRLREIGLVAEACAAAENAATKAPRSIDALLEASRCCALVGRLDRSRTYLDSILALDPSNIAARIDQAVWTCLQGRFDEAEATLLELRLGLAPGDPNLAIVEYNLSWHAFRAGRFKDGMRLLHRGREFGAWGNVNHPFLPQLQRDSRIDGKRILVCGEGGAGDEIIGVRFAEIMERRGARVIWVSSNDLETVFARSPGVSQCLKRSEIDSVAFDLWAPSMDLPYLLDLDRDDISDRPYLIADPVHVRKWKERTGSTARPKVGVRWKGNARYQTDAWRSVEYRLFSRLLETPGADFYSLQRDVGADERPKDSPAADWGTEFRSWNDTLGAISNLDLVITTCTSIAHVAAAMGKPTWILCPAYCYYVWASPGDRSLWYPDVRLFRQERSEDWQSVFTRVETQLRSFISR